MDQDVRQATNFVYDSAHDCVRFDYSVSGATAASDNSHVSFAPLAHLDREDDGAFSVHLAVRLLYSI